MIFNENGEILNEGFFIPDNGINDDNYRNDVDKINEIIKDISKDKLDKMDQKRRDNLLANKAREALRQYGKVGLISGFALSLIAGIGVILIIAVEYLCIIPLRKNNAKTYNIDKENIKLGYECLDFFREQSNNKKLPVKKREEFSKKAQELEEVLKKADGYLGNLKTDNVFDYDFSND